MDNTPALKKSNATNSLRLFLCKVERGYYVKRKSNRTYVNNPPSVILMRRLDL